MNPVISFAESSGTWVIENEEVVFTNTTFTHEGNIIIRGTGKLLLKNSTMRLEQATSKQFSIRIEDSAQFVADQSYLESKYNFKIIAQDSGKLNVTDTLARRTCFDLVGLVQLQGNTSRVYSISAGGNSEVNIDSCRLEQLYSKEYSTLLVSNSNCSFLNYLDESLVSVTDSQVGIVLCDGNQLAYFNRSFIDSARLWSQCHVSIDRCTMHDLRYSDLAQASITKSSIGYLDVTGQLLLQLEDIVVDELILRGSPNVRLNDCDIGRIMAYQYSLVSIFNSSCDYLFATEFAKVRIQGSSVQSCNVTECIITQSAHANISWGYFYYLEIAHSTTAMVNDTYAYDFNNWAYTTCVLDIFRCRFHWFRTYAWTYANLVNTTVESWANIGEGTNFNATSCTFGSELTFYGATSARCVNCTITMLRPLHESQVTLDNCTAVVAVIDYRARLQKVQSLSPGYLTYWHSNESGSLVGVLWNLTAINTTITGWRLHLWYRDYCEVDNCTLEYLGTGQNEEVVVNNATIGEVDMRHQSRLVINDATITGGAQRDTSVGIYNNCSIGTMHLFHSSEASFNSCSIDVFYPIETSSFLSNYSYFNFMNINGDVDVAFYNSEVYRIDGWSIHNFYAENTNFTWGISFYSVHSAEFYDCNIQGVSASTTSTFSAEGCYIARLTGYGSSTFSGRNNNIDQIFYYDSSNAYFYGNLSGISYFWVADSATIFRLFNVQVLDQSLSPISGALVTVRAPDNSTLLTLLTDSTGNCEFHLVFIGSNRSLFMSTYSILASYLGSNTVADFNTTSIVPILVLIDTAGELSLMDLQDDKGVSDDSFEIGSPIPIETPIIGGENIIIAQTIFLYLLIGLIIVRVVARQKTKLQTLIQKQVHSIIELKLIVRHFTKEVSSF
ncbi:MAG: hypothetical protein ACFFCT_11525 [Candidatus Odinarchaeota archaeon]